MNNKLKKLIQKKLTPKQRADLLISAKILDKDGNYLPEYFPLTIEQQKKQINSIFNTK
jgi:hypothetical protein